MNLFEVADKRKTTVEIVVDKIKELLILKKLKPGDIIPSETVLTESLKVSRGSIREAMKILSAYGIVEVKHGHGTFVSTMGNPKLFDPLLFSILISGYDYKELIEVRDTLERGIVRHVISWATDEELQKLNEIMLQFEQASREYPDDIERSNRFDIMYHQYMAELTNNKLYNNIYNFIIDLFAPTINALKGFETHRKFHEAIMARDEGRALVMLTQHTQTWSATHREP